MEFLAYAIAFQVYLALKHIAHPDGRLIPFDTYNLFYRDTLESKRLVPLRLAAEERAHA